MFYDSNMLSIRGSHNPVLEGNQKQYIVVRCKEHHYLVTGQEVALILKWHIIVAYLWCLRDASTTPILLWGNSF